MGTWILVLDEGYDTFHIVNPNPKKKQEDPDDYQYDNDEILRQVTAFTLWRTDLDRQECEETEVKMAVEPRRSQMRFMLIFAVRRDAIRQTKK